MQALIHAIYMRMQALSIHAIYKDNLCHSLYIVLSSVPFYMALYGEPYYILFDPSSLFVFDPYFTSHMSPTFLPPPSSICGASPLLGRLLMKRANPVALLVGASTAVILVAKLLVEYE